MDLPRLLRTVRYLKPIQVYSRLGHRLPGPGPNLGLAPHLRVFAEAYAPFVNREPSLVGPTRARFLGEEADFTGPEGWNDPARSRLWLYNLHYFDDLTAGGGAERRDWRRRMVDRWIDENPPGAGTGWEPYPTALRIVNWIKWTLSGAPPRAQWTHSLAVQTRWLVERLEWRLLGNHLMADIKALIFAGLFFEGAEAHGWLTRGLALHRRQLEEQVLSDGGHFERSPMYHAIMLEDLLDLINLGRASGVVAHAVLEHWREVARTMLHWLAAMVHPDGEISFFNDAAFGIAPSLAVLEAYANRLGLNAGQAPWPGADGVTPFMPSGYIRLASGEALALIDAAPIGPDYLPGHAHADTLSFELSLGQERIIVNGGTSTYAAGMQRERERATASHSTVEVNGQDSSEVWAGFRVGRRARVHEVSVESRDGAFAVSAAHDGYRHLPGRPIHRRSWRMTETGLSVTDAIEGRCEAAVARFHLHPDVKAVAGPEGRVGQLTSPSGHVLEWTSSEPVRIESSEWRPRFGLRREAVQLAIPLAGQPLVTEFRW